MKTNLLSTVIAEEYENKAGGSKRVAGATDTPYFKSDPDTEYIYSFECQHKSFNINDAKRILQSSALVP